MLKSKFNLKTSTDDEEDPQGGTEGAAKPNDEKGKAAGAGGAGGSGGARGKRGSRGAAGMTDGEMNEEMQGEMQGEMPGEGMPGEGTPEEVRIVYPVRVLQRSEVSTRLSLLGKTAEGDGFTYLKATCTGMGLTDITALKAFKHLQFVDVSNNNLELEALQVLTELPFLVLIHADKNASHSAGLNKMKYLQVIIMNENFITSVKNVYQPELCTLEVGNNKIKEIAFDDKMPNIKCLDFRNNLIQDISKLDFPNLDSLYLAGNKITSLVGLETLHNLRILHVRNNPIKLLDGFDAELKKLNYVNLRNCKVSTLKQVKKLRVLPALETLVMKGCPYMGGVGEETADVAEEEDSEIRIEMLAALPKLKRLNKGVVTPEERAEAKDLMMQWLEEGEKDEEEVGEEQQAEEESNVD